MSSPAHPSSAPAACRDRTRHRFAVPPLARIAVAVGTLAVTAALAAPPRDAEAPPTAAEAEAIPHPPWQSLVRVHAIAWRLLTAAVPACPGATPREGFLSWIPPAVPGPSTDPPAPTGLTVLAVHADGPAARGGLRPGDTLIAADGVPWGPTPAEGVAFHRAVATGLGTPDGTALTVRRDGREAVVRLVGQPACPVGVSIVAGSAASAHATATGLVVSTRLERRLAADDDALAFVVAHEIGHVLMRHAATPPSDRAERAAFEDDADAFGLRLMVAAGFDPEGAMRAIATVDEIGRGPFTRRLGLFGHYRSTPERIRFLRDRLADSGPGLGVALPPR